VLSKHPISAPAAPSCISSSSCCVSISASSGGERLKTSRHAEGPQVPYRHSGSRLIGGPDDGDLLDCSRGNKCSRLCFRPRRDWSLRSERRCTHASNQDRDLPLHLLS